MDQQPDGLHVTLIATYSDPEQSIYIPAGTRGTLLRALPLNPADRMVGPWFLVTVAWATGATVDHYRHEVRAITY